MEEESESRTSLNSHQDEESKEELERDTKANIEHVALCHNLSIASDDVSMRDGRDVPFSSKSDSLALLSVYRYAKQIKSFLEWENILEESALEGNSQDSPSQDSPSQDCCVRKESCVSHSEALDKRKENDYGRLSENEISCESNSETSSNHSRRNSFQNFDEISRYFPQKICGSLTNLNENPGHNDESDFDLNDGNTKTTPYQKIFRSEVNIIVEDWCNSSIPPSSLNDKINPATENSISSISGVMDDSETFESLIEEEAAINIGLSLNDVGSILKDELHAIKPSPHEIECTNTDAECNQFGKNTSNIVNSCNTCDENISEKRLKDTDEEFKRENNLNGCDSEDKEKVTPVEKDNLKKNLDERLLEKNVEQENNKETGLRNVEEQDNSGSKCTIGNSEALKRSLVDNVDKLVGQIIHEKSTNNAMTPKNDKTFKVHIQYENEITKQPKSKDVIGGERQNLNHQDRIFSEDTECGFSIFRPRWLQPYATVKVYVILYSIMGILHGSYYSYLIGTISTLEKRYAFKSKISGVIMIVDEITPLLLGVIIAYYAGKANRPRMIAFGMLLSACCCFCSSLPYFIYGHAQYTTVQNVQTHTSTKICDRNSETCDLEGRPPTLPAVLYLVFGSFLKGFGNLAYYAIGLAYLDDNSNKETTPVYLAIALALRLVGPLVGFLMSSAFLKLYESPTVDPGYGPDDPRWIGAWWIGFFLQGVLLVIFTLPIALFPRRLPGQRRVEKYTAPSSEDGLKKLFQGLFSALKRLGANPVFVLMIVNTNMKVFGHFGHSIMLPKYMENQFRLSASEASLYSGATSITFVMLSTIIGGCLIWKFRPTIKVLLGGMIVSETLLCVGFLILIIPRCHTVDMVNFGMSDEGLILNGVCNEKCDCSTTSYTPFCGPEGTTYFSPCYAGCTQEIASSMIPKHKEFRNCSCVVSSAADKNLASSIYEGVCPDEKCWSQAIIYLIIYFFLLITSNAFTVAHSMILLRSVHPSDKTIALGTFETFICLFGFIPFPVAFGALVDSACLVWEKSCGEVGNCWFYDMKKYSYLLHGVGSLFCSFSVMCLIGLYFLSPRVRDLYADEEEEIVDIKLDTVSGSSTRL